MADGAQPARRTLRQRHGAAFGATAAEEAVFATVGARTKPMSKYRRRSANAKERLRMHQVGSAFLRLKQMVSVNREDEKEAAGQAKDTRVWTLRSAIAYINALTLLLDDLRAGRSVSPEYYCTDEQLGIGSHAEAKSKSRPKKKKATARKTKTKRMCSANCCARKGHGACSERKRSRSIKRDAHAHAVPWVERSVIAGQAAQAEFRKAEEGHCGLSASFSSGPSSSSSVEGDGMCMSMQAEWPTVRQYAEVDQDQKPIQVQAGEYWSGKTNNNTHAVAYIRV